MRRGKGLLYLFLDPFWVIPLPRNHLGIVFIYGISVFCDYDEHSVTAVTINHNIKAVIHYLCQAILCDGADKLPVTLGKCLCCIALTINKIHSGQNVPYRLVKPLLADHAVPVIFHKHCECLSCRCTVVGQNNIISRLDRHSVDVFLAIFLKNSHHSKRIRKADPVKTDISDMIYALLGQ